jgi:hypothetical protein
MVARVAVLAALVSAFAAAPLALAAPRDLPQLPHTLPSIMPHDSNVITLNEESIDGPAFWSIASGEPEPGPNAPIAVLAWTGTDAAHSLNVMTSTDGINYGNKITLDEESFTRPSVLLLRQNNANIIVLAWTGTDANHSLNVMYDVYGAQRKITIGDDSNYAPSLAFFQGQVLLAWTGTDINHSLNIKQMGSQGLTDGAKTILSQYSSDAQPSIFTDIRDHQLLLTWSYNSSPNWINVASSPDGVNFTEPLAGGPPPQTSNAAPDMMAVSQTIESMYPYYWTWTGTDPLHSINITATNTLNNWPAPIVTTDQQAFGGPVLGFIGQENEVLIVWTGIDAAHHLNIMTLDTTSLPPL